MLADYLASDDRFFFEQEFAPLLKTQQCKDGWDAASAKAYGSGERTLIEFQCKHRQKNLFSFLNLDARNLKTCGIDSKTLAEHLLRGKHSPMFDRHEFDIESVHLMFWISEYRNRGRTGKEWVIDPLSDLWTGDKPLIRVVEMNLRHLVLLPRVPRT